MLCKSRPERSAGHAHIGKRRLFSLPSGENSLSNAHGECETVALDRHLTGNNKARRISSSVDPSAAISSGTWWSASSALAGKQRSDLFLLSVCLAFFLFFLTWNSSFFCLFGRVCRVMSDIAEVSNTTSQWIFAGCWRLRCPSSRLGSNPDNAVLHRCIPQSVVM